VTVAARVWIVRQIGRTARINERESANPDGHSNQDHEDQNQPTRVCCFQVTPCVECEADMQVPRTEALVWFVRS
jgi:hypothetical protein